MKSRSAIRQVRLVLAQVAHHAAGPGDRPGRAEVDRVLLRQHADALGAIDEDAVARQQLVDLVERAPAKLLDELPHLVDPVGVHVEQHAADARVAGVKPLARGVLDDVVNLLALLKAVQKRGERAQVERRRAHVEQVIVQPHQLGQDRPQILAPRRQLDAQQLLDRMMPGDLVRHRRDVIHPVDDRHVLVEVEMLAQLLEPAVQVADVRHRVDDLLAVEREHQAQRRVRRRMLRTEVERPQVLLLDRRRSAAYRRGSAAWRKSSSCSALQ